MHVLLTTTAKHNYYAVLDTNKDQSYFLHALNQHQLSHTLFPIGEFDKPYIRELANKNNLVTHDKKDSTGICFIGERRFNTFLEKYLPALNQVTFKRPKERQSASIMV